MTWWILGTKNIKSQHILEVKPPWTDFLFSGESDLFLHTWPLCQWWSITYPLISATKWKANLEGEQPNPIRKGDFPNDHRNWVKTWPWLNDYGLVISGDPAWLRMELRTWIFLTPKILENRQRFFLETSRWWRLKHYIIYVYIYTHIFTLKFGDFTWRVCFVK